MTPKGDRALRRAVTDRQRLRERLSSLDAEVAALYEDVVTGEDGGDTQARRHADRAAAERERVLVALADIDVRIERLLDERAAR